MGAVIVGGDTRTEQAAHLVTAGIAGVVTIVIIAFISDKVTAGAVHIVGTVIVGGDACLVCVILGLQFFATIIAEERVGTVPIVLSSLGNVIALVETGVTVENGSNLTAGGVSGGIKNGGALSGGFAADYLVGSCPGESICGPILNILDVLKAFQRSIGGNVLAIVLSVAVNHGRHLLTGDGIVGAEQVAVSIAEHDFILAGPNNSISIPCIFLDIGEAVLGSNFRFTGHTVEDGCNHGTSGGGLRLKVDIAIIMRNTVHQRVCTDELYIIVEPVFLTHIGEGICNGVNIGFAIAVDVDRRGADDTAKAGGCFESKS